MVPGRAPRTRRAGLAASRAVLSLDPDSGLAERTKVVREDLFLVFDSWLFTESGTTAEEISCSGLLMAQPYRRLDGTSSTKVNPCTNTLRL